MDDARTETTSSISIPLVPFCTYIFIKVGDLSFQVCLHNFRLKQIPNMSGQSYWASAFKHSLAFA